MGLIHPGDLRAWQRWQDRRRGVRGLLGRVRAAQRAVPARFHLTTGGGHPRILIALESLSPSQRAAVLAPLQHLPLDQVAILSLGPVDAALPEHPWQQATTTDPFGVTLLDGVKAVLATGHYLPAGSAAYALATVRGLPFGVVQHGLLVPMAPPLPAGAHLLAWSAEDSAFWLSERIDVTTQVVGSQLLWDAAVPDAEALSRERMVTWAARHPVYLGQLHGAELGRWRMFQAAHKTLRATAAIYRPHPQERDIVSGQIHRWWQRRSVTIDRTGVPLPELEAPIIGVFSTGILEAAARGIPAWVDYPHPPRWLAEFWQRYSMNRLGEMPTPPPMKPTREPATAVSDWLTRTALTEG